MKPFIVIFTILLITYNQGAAADSAESIVRDTTEKVLERLANERQKLESDPAILQSLVRELVIPQFDFDKMTRLVLGTRWNELDNKSRHCLIQGFSNVLIDRYADILLSYDNQTITYEAARILDKQGYVSVRQTISRSGSRPLPVDYPLQRHGNDWKVIDIIVDGASLIRNYRGIYQYEINRKGFKEFVQSFPECAN